MRVHMINGGAGPHESSILSQLTSAMACLCLPWLIQALTDLGPLGGDFVPAFADNEHGQIAGRASAPSSPIHAFLFSPLHATPTAP